MKEQRVGGLRKRELFIIMDERKTEGKEKSFPFRNVYATALYGFMLLSHISFKFSGPLKLLSLFISARQKIKLTKKVFVTFNCRQSDIVSLALLSLEFLCVFEEIFCSTFVISMVIWQEIEINFPIGAKVRN